MDDQIEPQRPKQHAQGSGLWTDPAHRSVLEHQTDLMRVRLEAIACLVETEPDTLKEAWVIMARIAKLANE